jgi:hypothetical protein
MFRPARQCGEVCGNKRQRGHTPSAPAGHFPTFAVEETMQKRLQGCVHPTEQLSGGRSRTLQPCEIALRKDESGNRQMQSA